MLRSGSICLSFIYNYLTENDSENNNEEVDKKSKKIRCLATTFEKYGGVLSKLAQILSFNDSSNSVFSDCKPFSRDETINFLKEQLNNSPFNNIIKTIDMNILKSGSIGQVHRAQLIDNSDVILKVQYVGLYEQTQIDLNILNTVVKYMYNFIDIKDVMEEIKIKLYEELDYNNEVINHKMMYNFWNDCEYVEIPEIISELCTDKIICMKYINGRSLQDFIENSTQEEKNKLGECIIKFTFKNIYSYGLFYSDIHYGNFLAKEDSTICVLDFGCMIKIDDELKSNLIKLHLGILQDNKELFYNTVINLGIITENISAESYDYIHDFFRIQCSPFIEDEFEFTEEWLLKCSDKNFDLMKEWKIPQNMVYLHKITYGCYHLLTKLNLKGNFKNLFNDFLIV